jgi:hypothetical protein
MTGHPELAKDSELLDSEGLDPFGRLKRPRSVFEKSAGPVAGRLGHIRPRL